ncbi:hypothetical protein GYMLUDRAFT_249215 [Collybiopsis luxurians FD-317 M1]|uniref:Uncharacterized protein n=1 Tax=Collybiopsis luxurians FD-317 M1 TaxID=944289 RepID=A0A0D0CIQ5_9AGAR|nr:hypothetical protein GYMLUDRAFT_249215 [Collybiopsis luxurians FD-317 M1]
MELVQEWREENSFAVENASQPYNFLPNYLYTMDSPRRRLEDRGRSILDWIRWQYKSDFDVSIQKIPDNNSYMDSYSASTTSSLESESSILKSLYNGVGLGSLDLGNGEELDPSFEAALNSILNAHDDEDVLDVSEVLATGEDANASRFFCEDGGDDLLAAYDREKLRDFDGRQDLPQDSQAFNFSPPSHIRRFLSTQNASKSSSIYTTSSPLIKNTPRLATPPSLPGYCISLSPKIRFLARLKSENRNGAPISLKSPSNSPPLRQSSPRFVLKNRCTTGNFSRDF